VRKLALLAAAAAAALLTMVAPAWAGSPHFVDGTVQATVDGTTLTVTGKEAGLGDELQAHVTATATAQCRNPGGNDPQAGNKQSFTAAGDFPVMNGKLYFSLDLAATFQPSCSPPMTVVWLSPVVVTDETNGITTTVSL